MGRLISRWIITGAVSILTVIGCGPKKPEVSMTSGQATIGASDAIFDLAWQVSKDFQALNRSAFVDIVRGDDVALVDSLLNKRTEQIFLDRALTPAETLAFKQANLKLYQYTIALYPVFLLVHRANPVSVIDSAELRGVLTGNITNWNQLGGGDAQINVYASLPGDGPWQAITTYFGQMDSAVAVACSTSAKMIELAKDDRSALLIFAKPYQKFPYKALRFRRGEVEILASAKTIDEEPRYPFRLDLTYVTTRNKVDVAAGYLTYASGNLGQKGIMNEGYRPAMVPVKVIQL